MYSSAGVSYATIYISYDIFMTTQVALQTRMLREIHAYKRCRKLKIKDVLFTHSDLYLSFAYVEIMFIVDVHPLKCISSTRSFDQKYNCKSSCKVTIVSFKKSLRTGETRMLLRLCRTLNRQCYYATQKYVS